MSSNPNFSTLSEMEIRLLCWAWPPTLPPIDYPVLIASLLDLLSAGSGSDSAEYERGAQLVIATLTPKRPEVTPQCRELKD